DQVKALSPGTQTGRRGRLIFALDATMSRQAWDQACKLQAEMFHDITVKDGRVEQSNFHDYPMVHLAEAPKVESIIMPSGGFWGGVGEPPPALVAPALCNAIFAATGKRIRALPLKNHDLRA